MDRKVRVEQTQVTFKVFFEEPFWVGMVERIEEGRLTASKITFGPEPKDYEIYEYVKRNWFELRFSPSVEVTVKQDTRINPKRLQRLVKKQIDSCNTLSKSFQAMKLLQEENKTIRKVKSKEQKELEMEWMFELKQQQRKEKHKGR